MSEQQEISINDLADQLLGAIAKHFGEANAHPQIGDLSAALGLVIGRIAVQYGINSVTEKTDEPQPNDPNQLELEEA